MDELDATRIIEETAFIAGNDSSSSISSEDG